jgi:hypothetical protein
LNNVEAGLNWQFVRWSDIDVYVRNMVKRYKNDEVLDSDRDRTDVGLAVWRQIARRTGLQLVGKVSDYGFKKAVAGAVDRDFASYLLTLRGEQKLSETFRTSLSLGGQSVNYSADNLGSQSGLYGEIEMHGAIREDLRASAAYNHAMREADVHPYASQKFDEIHGRLDWDASGFVTLGGGAAYRLSEYDQDQKDPTADDPKIDGQRVISGNETTVALGVDVTFKFGNKGGALRIAQTYERVDSDVWVDFTRNTSSIGYSIAL